MAANNIKQQTTLTMADGRRIKYTVLKRSNAGATMAKRSLNNAAPKGSFMHAGMAVHAASIGTGTKSSKACYSLITDIGPIVYSYWTSLTTVTWPHICGVFVCIIII